MSKKSTIGRKSAITENVLQKLKEAFLMGCTDREACILADIAESTLYDFQKKNKQFLEEKQGWKTNPVLKARTTIYENLTDVKIAMWYLERKCKDEFSNKHITTNEIWQVPRT